MDKARMAITERRANTAAPDRLQIRCTVRSDRPAVANLENLISLSE